MSDLGPIVPVWAGPARVRAMFTARNDDIASVGLPANPVWLSQVHGRDAVQVDARNVDTLLAVAPQADAAITRLPGVVLAVRTADCLPVLLADRAGSVLAVAHAGWRGLAAGVLDTTVAAMGVAARDIAAWIGPAIGPRAFEVGTDVHAAYCVSDPACETHFAPQREGKWLADLPALARRRLALLGIDDVAGGTWCTFSDASRFYSYRRDKRSGRMALVAWLASATA